MKERIVLMILNQRFLPDIRVEQEYNALTAAGYRTIVVASEGGLDNENYEIIRINPYAQWSQIYNLSLVYNPILKGLIINKLSKRGIGHVDVIHVHDLFWSFLGFQLKRYFNSKLVIDMHENYPEYIRDITSEHSASRNDLHRRWQCGAKRNEVLTNYTRPMRMGTNSESTKKANPRQITLNLLKAIVHPGFILKPISNWAHSVKRLTAYENKMLQRCDRFIVVVDEALERFKEREYYSKSVVVSNTKDHRLWHFNNIPDLKNKLKVSYVGSIQDLRGLDTAILAMKYLNQAEYELNIVGIIAGSPMYERFRGIIEDHDITNVNLIEWLQNEGDAIAYINNPHVCIVPHKDTGLTRTTVPHKLFMYMAIGRPVLVSDVAPLRRIVSDANNGLIFKANDPIDFANKLKRLRNPVLLSQLAYNGRLAAENQYSWSQDKERLIALYSELMGNT